MRLANWPALPQVLGNTAVFVGAVTVLQLGLGLLIALLVALAAVALPVVGLVMGSWPLALTVALSLLAVVVTAIAAQPVLGARLA